jgi:hypothetical protein
MRASAGKVSDALAKLHTQLDVSAGGLRAHVPVQSARSGIAISTGYCERYELFLWDFASPSRSVRNGKRKIPTQLIVSRREACSRCTICQCGTNRLLAHAGEHERCIAKIPMEFCSVSFCSKQYPLHVRNLISDAFVGGQILRFI